MIYNVYEKIYGTRSDSKIKDTLKLSMIMSKACLVEHSYDKSQGVSGKSPLLGTGAQQVCFTLKF